ncbi:DUF3267 domain-containing protein [Clostridium sp. LIBA-8841]|uniref:DUF3267 domain-containing protein n=1 Tax=Clostridium sp. LIBA-8841 TaxID=2987530 RepID=UPI002AC52BC1|nr:DUF3267 domain-containing protein [Clostridium sp. LIBA-8841]MDZ5254512.1 DUF3267 domain-containing protein [Clostridium sp. LIBA-8841]
MRYINKIPRKNNEVYDEMVSEGWQFLKEPKSLRQATLISIPISLISAIVSILFLISVNGKLSDSISRIFSSNQININIKLSYIILIYLYILFHEIIHLVFIPQFIKSKSTFISLKWWGGFVYTEEELSKFRFLVITIMPFIMLSFIFPIILIGIGVSPILVLILAIINSAGSSVDILNFFLIIVQVPNKGIIKNIGTKTLFKL